MPLDLLLFFAFCFVLSFVFFVCFFSAPLSQLSSLGRCFCCFCFVLFFVFLCLFFVLLCFLVVSLAPLSQSSSYILFKLLPLTKNNAFTFWGWSIIALRH